MDRVPRRDFLLTGMALVTAPLAVRAQQPGKVYRVGLIATTSPVSELAGPEPVNPAVRALVQSLRVLGYVEGQNLILDRRSAEGRFERFGEIVSELVRLKADVIVVPGDRLPKVAKAVTTTVPIVLASSINPVGEGLVQSLARPGGNITGLTTLVGPEIEAKRLELLRAMVPSVSRIAYLAARKTKTGEPLGAERSNGRAGLGCDAGSGRVHTASVHGRLRADQPHAGRGGLRFGECGGLRRPSCHRGPSVPGSAARHSLLSGGGGTRGI